MTVRPLESAMARPFDLRPRGAVLRIGFEAMIRCAAPCTLGFPAERPIALSAGSVFLETCGASVGVSASEDLLLFRVHTNPAE